MNKPITIFLISILPHFITSCNSHVTESCEVKAINTLYTIPGVYEGKITGYSHYVLIRNFNRACMDSAKMVRLALKYSDTIKVGKPADIIMFFNSDKDFIPNEISQDMDKINKSCLVIIDLDLKNKKPTNFIFYNKRGERTYWGNRWLPNGK